MTSPAQRLFDTLAAKATALGRRLTKEEWLDTVGGELATMGKETGGEARLKPAPVPRKRNDLLDALISLCGGDPTMTTKSEFKTAATSLAEIKTVCPDLTVAELEQRVARYRQKNRDWQLTPMALAKWWSHLGGGPRTQSEASDIYMEPPGWRSVLQNMYELSNEGIRDKEWLDISPDTRRQVLQRMKRA